MYKHILIPTDGSRRCERAARDAIRLARTLGARVTALHVVPDADYPALEAWARHDPKFAQHLDAAFRTQASLFVDSVREEAMRSGVRCDCRVAKAPMPHEAIVRAAHDYGCDLIFMSPRTVAEPAMHDSQTAKVASLGDIPVLVHH